MELNLNDPNLQKKYGYTLNPSTDPVGTGSNISAVIPSAQSVPATTPTVQPTVPQAQYPRYTDGQTLPESEYERTAREYYAGLNREMPDEAAIRESTRARMQGVIDSISAQYAPQIAQERDVNAPDRLGRTRAIQSRGGLLGSPRAEAQTEQTRQLNSRAMAAIESEKNARIQEVMGRIDQMAEEKIRAQKQEALGNADKYLSYLKSVQEQRQENLKTLATGGVPLEQLSSDAYKKLLDSYGGDEFLMKAAYNTYKPKTEQIDYKTQIVNGKLFAWGFDPATGKFQQYTQDLPAGVGGTNNMEYKMQFTNDGTALLIPDKFDPNKSIQDQIVMYGAEGQWKAPTSDGGGTITERDRVRFQAPISAAREKLEESKQGGEFIDGNVFRQLRQDFMEMYGTTKPFDDTFISELSPTDRAKYGLGKASGTDATPNEDADLAEMQALISQISNAGN